MAQDLTIGRVGLATTVGGDGVEVSCTSWESDGDDVSFDGLVTGASSAAAKAVRDQLDAYNATNPDEKVVPVTFSVDTTRNGYYRILAVAVSPEVRGKLGDAAETYEFSVAAIKVPNFQAPLWEKLCSGATRTGGAASGVSWASYPATATQVQQVTAPTTGTATTLEAELGDVVLLTNTSTYYDETILMNLDPTTFYQVAAKVERSVDNGSTFYTVAGKQILNDPTSGWRINNGLVRVSYSTTLDVAMWDDGGGSWESISYKCVANGVTATSLGTPNSVQVIRNAPEFVSVRLAWSVADTPPVMVYCDLTLRQGQPWVEGYLSTMSTNTKAFGVFRSATEAGTSYTGGLEATSADGAGNKYRIHAKSTGYTKDTTNGGIYLSSAGTNMPFAIGSNVQGITNTTEATYYNACMEHYLMLVGV